MSRHTSKLRLAENIISEIVLSPPYLIPIQIKGDSDLSVENGQVYLITIQLVSFSDQFPSGIHWRQRLLILEYLEKMGKEPQKAYIDD